MESLEWEGIPRSVQPANYCRNDGWNRPRIRPSRENSGYSWNGMESIGHDDRTRPRRNDMKRIMTALAMGVLALLLWNGSAGKARAGDPQYTRFHYYPY